MGTVDAYDTSNNTYRIRFDRESLGTQSVPDEDVVSAGELETLPLSTFTVPKPRPQRPIIGKYHALKICNQFTHKCWLLHLSDKKMRQYRNETKTV